MSHKYEKNDTFFHDTSIFILFHKIKKHQSHNIILKKTFHVILSVANSKSYIKLHAKFQIELL